MFLLLKSGVVLNMARIVAINKSDGAGQRQIICSDGGRPKLRFTPQDEENLREFVTEMNARACAPPVTSGEASLSAEDVELMNLRAYCDKHGISYNKTHKIKGLERSIALWKARNGQTNQPSGGNDPAAVGATSDGDG